MLPPPKINPEELKNQIKNRLFEGFCLEAIAKEFKITTDFVILNLLSHGLFPSQIAKQLGISTSTLIQQIDAAVHARSIRRSEIESSLDQELLRYIKGLMGGPKKCSVEKALGILKAIDAQYELNVEDLSLYQLYIGKSFRPVDMYEILYEIEVNLHTKVREVLIENYGAGEAGWWKKGVHVSVRTSCAEAHEHNIECVNEPKYNFTTLIDLKVIIEKKWEVFCNLFPAYPAKEKDDFKTEFDRLNTIRNKVMHPIRGSPPTDEEFDFVKQMRMKLDLRRGSKK